MKLRSSSPRRVAVITGTRAEFGLLESVLRAMRDRPKLHADLIVTGMHLLPRFGHTIEDIQQRGWAIAAKVRMQNARDSASDQAAAVARGIAGIARAIDRLNSDIVLVLGDRIEAFAGAVAATTTHRVLAHIHGGDRAVGDLDGALRDAITRLAHVHFAASKDAVRRLRRMGEQPARIRLTGAPGLDDILAFRRDQEQRAEPLRGPGPKGNYALVVQHPCGRAPGIEEAVMDRIVKAVVGTGLTGFAIYPNSDLGHSGIIRALERARRQHGWTIARSLPREEYLSTAMRAALLVGNSSSGFIESASLGVNAVDIGDRQRGRLPCGPSVIHSSENPAAIKRAICNALGKARPSSRRSVYGDGRAGLRIAKALEGLIISPSLRFKSFTF